MRKKLVFFIALLFLCAALWGIYLFNKPHSDVRNVKAAITTDAPQLFADYQQDEQLANKKYLDKVIRVKGTVEEIQQTDSTITILLNSGTPVGGVICNVSLNEIENAASIVKETPVTIKGKCAGFLMDVNLVDCVIEK